MNQAATIDPLNDTTLDQLCAILVAEKAKLTMQQNNVREAEEAIVAAVGTKDEGSATVECDRYKVTTTQPIRRTVDKQMAIDLQADVPPDVYDGLFDWKPSLSVKVYKDLEKYRPELHAKISRAVMSKAGKPSVKVEDLV